MTNLLCKVHPDAKKTSAYDYVVVTEPTGSEGHPYAKNIRMLTQQQHHLHAHVVCAC